MIKNIKIILLSISIILLTSFNLVDIKPIYNSSINYYDGGKMIWVTGWLASDNQGPGYGKGRFFYALSRSQYPIDGYGNYLYEIYFVSDSYYTINRYYDSNGDGNIDVYRSATKIDNVSLYVNNAPYGNSYIPGNPVNFWILFQGRIDFSGNIYPDKALVGFYNKSPNCNVFIRWSTPYPF